MLFKNVSLYEEYEFVTFKMMLFKKRYSYTEEHSKSVFQTCILKVINSIFLIQRQTLK